MGTIWFYGVPYTSRSELISVLLNNGVIITERNALFSNCTEMSD